MKSITQNPGYDRFKMFFALLTATLFTQCLTSCSADEIPAETAQSKLQVSNAVQHEADTDDALFAKDSLVPEPPKTMAIDPPINPPVPPKPPKP